MNVTKTDPVACRDCILRNTSPSYLTGLQAGPSKLNDCRNFGRNQRRGRSSWCHNLQGRVALFRQCHATFGPVYYEKSGTQFLAQHAQCGLHAAVWQPAVACLDA